MRAGLVVFGYDYGWVDLRRGSEGRTEPVQAPGAEAQKGGVEHVAAAIPWVDGRAVCLPVTVALDLTGRFFYREAESEGDFSAFTVGR